MRVASRRLLRTTHAMVVIWILALLAGMANACLLQPALPDAASSIVVPALSHGWADGGHHHAADPAGPDDGHPADAAPACIKHCVDEASALVKLKAAPIDSAAPLAPESFARFGDDDASGTRMAPVPVRPAPPGPPLVIRFLRLTI